jgi:ABC-type Fe3+ transport system substrate-binding protein
MAAAAAPAAASGSSPAPSPATGASPGTASATPLVVYAARDNPVELALLTAFGAQHGVRVQRVVVSRDSVSRMLAQSRPEDRPDLLLSNDAAALEEAVRAGQLAPLPVGTVRTVPGWHDAERRWVALTIRGRAVHAARDTGLAASELTLEQLAAARGKGGLRCAPQPTRISARGWPR